MASTYSPLKIELIGTGEQVATWGQTTNTNLGTTIEQAIGGKADVTMSSTSVALTLTDTNALQNARALYLNLTGTPGGAATLEVPAVQKAYIVKNGTTGGNAVTVKVAGQTGVSVPNGATMHLYNNGTDVVNAITNLPAGSTIGGSAISTASGTVSSVAAGNGMSFSTITSTGSVTLGTPSTLNTTTTNNVSGSTHTHAITTASASTASTIVARDSLGGFEATTIGMTTGNIGTLNVGTQTNKATISYTTNTARTLTIPALDGNRTFAFINQYQEWTAEQSFGEDVVFAKDIVVEDNLIFSGAGTFGYNRIQGNTAAATINDRLFFQDGAPNTTSLVNVMPSGTANNSGFLAYNSSTPGNSSTAWLYVDNTSVQIAANTYGSGTALPMTFSAGGSERMRITTGGEVYIAGTTDQGAYNLQVNGTGVWGAGLYVNGSDARLKEGIKDLDSGLSVIEKLHPVSFKYRQDTDYTKDTRTHIGFIAQELQTALADKDYVDGVVETGGKYLGVAYQSLIPILTKAIQELKQEIEALKAKG
jgi:hypothetical protein